MNDMIRRLTTASAVACSRLRRRGVGCLICSAPVPERNRGDQAFLTVVVQELEKRGCGPLTILTTSNQPVASINSSPGVQIRTEFYPLFLTRRAFQEELRFPGLAAKHAEMLVIGADVLDEGYGTDRSVATMHAIDLAHRVGLGTRILGFSVNGPPSPGLRQRLMTLGKSTRLLVRDPESYRRLEAAGIPGIERAGDLAYLLEPVEFGELSREVRAFIPRHQGALIGLNLTNVVLEQYGAAETRTQLVVRACQQLAREDSWRFLLLPHDEPDGVDLLRKFQQQLDSAVPGASHLVDPLPHARNLKRIAGLCKHVFTCRLHLGIAAMGMGRPMTGFPYQGKFEGQFELFGLSTDGLIGADRFPTTVEDLVGLMRQRVATSEQSAQQIQAKLPVVMELARRNFDGLGVAAAGGGS